MKYKKRKVSSKQRVAQIVKILQDHSCQNHPLRKKEIIEYLSHEYGICASQNTISDDLQELVHAGIDICVEKAKGGIINLYYYEGAFDRSEAFVLATLLGEVKGISAGCCINIVEKMLMNVSAEDAGWIRQNTDNHTAAKTDNKRVMYIIDRILEAIMNHVNIRFDYLTFEGNGQDGGMHGEQLHTVSPFFFYCDCGFFYLIGYDCSDQKTELFRIDRIENEPELLTEEALMPEACLGLYESIRQVFLMLEADLAPKADTLLCINQIEQDPGPLALQKIK